MVQVVTQFPKDPQLEAARTPPHSIEAEQSVLGGLLLDNVAWDRIGDVVTEADFYRGDHRTIFQHIAKLIEHNQPADALTVAESLERSGKLAEVGGQAYIGSLALNTPSAANIRRYAEIVRDRSIMRNLAAVGTAIADSAYSPSGKDAHILIDEAEAKVFQIAEVALERAVPLHEGLLVPDQRIGVRIQSQVFPAQQRARRRDQRRREHDGGRTARHPRHQTIHRPATHAAGGAHA